MHFLNENELKSAVWQKTKAHIESRIVTLQKMLEGDADERKTANLRGRIAELRRFLTGEEPPVIKHPNAQY